MVNPGTIKAVLKLHKQGYSIVAIARTLNIHIKEVVEIVNEYT
jgi:hypothetical protein